MKVCTITTWLICTVVAGIFLYAGAVKIWHPAQLQNDIERYRLVPTWAAWALAAWLPYLEVFSALALLRRGTAAAGRLLLAALLIVFIAALLSAWVRGLNVACGCFGSATTEKPNYPWWIGRDLILLGGLAWLHLSQRRSADEVTLRRLPGEAPARVGVS